MSAHASASHAPKGDPAYGRLRDLVLTAPLLEPLVEAFGAAVAVDGVTGHICARIGNGTIEALFGDSPALVTRPDGFDIYRDPEQVVLRLSGRPAPGAAARVRGYALLYVARGIELARRSAEGAGASGLSVSDRFILGRILVGDHLVDIAAKLDRSVASVRESLKRATAALGATQPQEAVATAARKGLLLSTLPDFCPLSPQKIDYYS